MVVWMNKSELPNTITRWERILLFSRFSASLQSKGEVVLYPQSCSPTVHPLASSFPFVSTSVSSLIYVNHFHLGLFLTIYMG